MRTGGSDFHGSTLEGRPLGEPFVPETWLIELRNHWKVRNAPPPEMPEPSPASSAVESLDSEPETRKK